MILWSVRRILENEVNGMLQVNEMYFSYGKTEVLHGITFDMKQGEIVTIIDANGAGKSTTLNTIVGLQRAGRGKTLYKGQDISKAKPDSLVKMGIRLVPEGRQTFPFHTVEENLLIGAHTEQDHEKVAERMEAMYQRFPRLKQTGLETFKEVIDTLHENHPDCNVILNLTAAGGIANSEEARMAPFMQLKPEMASFDCCTMNWMYMGVFNNNPAFLEKMGLEMQKASVKPEVEVFHSGMIYDAGYYLKKGILIAPAHFQFCMGCAGGIAATAENLIFMRNTLMQVAPGSTWSAFCVGKGSMEIMYTAIAAGGHIRVGMEDTVLYKRGVPAQSNMQLIARARRVVEEFGCEVATSDEARQILGLAK